MPVPRVHSANVEYRLRVGCTNTHAARLDFVCERWRDPPLRRASIAVSDPRSSE
jgi:hypothetical protein